MKKSDPSIKVTIKNSPEYIYDSDRLEAVERYRFLEESPPQIFADTIKVVADLFAVEIAFVCLIDKDRKSLLSHVGMAGNSLPLKKTFCEYAIQDDMPFYVSNASQDQRFCELPWVTGAPHLEFYLGAPLITHDGFRIGTLSIAGSDNRTFSDHERNGLMALARLLMRQIEELEEKRNQDAEKTRLQTLLDDVASVMTEGLAVYDASDRLVFFNKRYKEFYDRSGETVKTGRKFEDIVIDGLQRGDYAVSEGGEAAWLEERLARHRNPPEHPFEQHLSDGRWVLVSERRLPNGGTLGVRTEITALKEKEQILAESEQKFRAYTQTASDWIWETDPLNRMAFIDGRHEHLSGVEKMDVIGKTRNEVTIEDTTSPKWIELDSKIANEQPFRDFTYRLLNRDGLQQIFSISGVPAHDSQGRFLGYRGTGRNITEAVTAKDRLQTAEARIRAALNNTLVGMVMIDVEGQVLEFNREAERMFQYRAAEIVGQNVKLLMPEDLAEHHDQFLKRHLETGKNFIIGKARRVIGRRKDGTLFPLTLGIGRIEIEGGTQFIGSLTDLSEQERLENQLQRAQKLEAVGQLTGGIAHDFNNILGIVLGNIELGLRKSEPDSKLHTYFERSHQAAERAAKITKQLLSFSRQKDFYSDSISCDLNLALKNVEALLRGSLTKGIDLKLELCTSPLIANVDAGDLQDVIVNLVMNARDAMSNSGRLVIRLEKITISGIAPPDLVGLPEGSYGVIIVSDNGPGIPAEIQERIFEPFFTTKPDGYGTGLGLAMVYGFTQRSRGEIMVSSIPGVGTCFRIFIPLFEDVPFSQPDIWCHAEVPLGNEHILVVDDESELVQYVKNTLEDLGYHVSSCSTPDDAIDIILKQPNIDLMLSDVVMPGSMSGIDLAARAKELKPNLRCLLTSRFPGETLLQDGNTKTELLSKPYNQQTLAQAIRRKLDERVGV